MKTLLTISSLVFTLIGLPSLSNAGSLYFECLKGKEWKIEKSQSTWFGKLKKGRIFYRTLGEIENEWSENEESEIYEDRVVMLGWVTTKNERCKPECDITKVMSLIPIPFQEIKTTEEYWLGKRTIDLKKEKLVRMKTIVTTDKCSVDKKDGCEEWNKGNEFSTDLCRLIEPIKIK